MAVNNGLITTLFILITTGLALGYGFSVKAQRLPFTPEIEFTERQGQFLKGWVKLALTVGILLPIALLVQDWGQPFSRMFWESYLLVVVVQLVSERILSQQLVPSIVVPIGFFYTAFRLWQLLDRFPQLSLSGLALVGFGAVALFWAGNLVMLTVMAIPTIYQRQNLQA